MTGMNGTSARPERGDSVEAAGTALRNLIFNRELLPGQQLRQDSLAERLGFSRGPMREALQALREEGIVTHAKNRGYAVTRLDFSEMQQIFTLRDLLESDVLRSLPKPKARHVTRLRKINDQLAQSTETSAIARHSQSIHFEMYETSPLTLIVGEIDRLWHRAGAYRVMMFATPSLPLPDVATAHANIIDAFADHDLDTLVDLCRDYRNQSLEGLRLMLG